MYEEPSSGEDGPITWRKRKTLKSGMQRTGATLVKRIPWPHEGLYSADGKLATYGNLTFTALVRGYLMVLDIEPDTKTKGLLSHHLEDLIEDSEQYGWPRVQAFHAAWLNHIEQGRSSWGDTASQLWL